MVRRACDRSFNAKLMEEFDELDVIRASALQENEDPWIEIPEFDASNVSDWLSKVEQSFRVRRFSDLDKLDLVAFSLEGYVLQWFSWEMSHNEFRSWDEFRRRLLLKFGAVSEDSSDNVDGNLQEKASYTEKTLIPQSQVPISSLEPGLRFSKESLVVSGASAKESIEKDESHEAKMVKVENKTAMFHNLAGISSAYQVFDKKSPHKERLKSKPKRKLSLSPKTWMFKFKNKNLQRQYSCSRATFGYKWKEQNSRYWRRIGQTHLSRLLCISQTNAETALEALKEIQSQQATVMRDGTKVSSLPAKELVSGDIVELRVGDKLQFLCEKVSIVSCLSLDAQFRNKMLQRNRSQRAPHHVMASNIIKYISFSSRATFGYTWQAHNSWYWRRMRQTHMSKLLCNLRVRQDPRELRQLILDDLKSHMRHKWKSKNRRAVFDLQNSPAYALDVVNKSSTSNSWCGWLVFDRGKSNIISGDVITLVSIKEFWIEIKDGDIAKLLNSTCGKLQSYDYGLEITFLRRLRVHQQQQKRKFIKSWRFKYKSSLPNTRSESGEMNKQGMDLHGVSGHRLFLRQQKSSSTWHRWRRKDWDLEVPLRESNLMILLVQHTLQRAQDVIGDHQQVHSTDPPELLAPVLWIPVAILEERFDEVGRHAFLIQWQDRDALENSWIYSKDFVQLYPFSKLEDKLVFGEGSIDTLHQVYRRKKRMTAQHSKSSSLGKTLLQSEALPFYLGSGESPLNS